MKIVIKEVKMLWWAKSTSFKRNVKPFAVLEKLKSIIGESQWLYNRTKNLVQKRGMRRSHDALASAQLSVDATSGELHLRHNVTAGGFYRGESYQQVICCWLDVLSDARVRCHGGQFFMLMLTPCRRCLSSQLKVQWRSNKFCLSFLNQINSPIVLNSFTAVVAMNEKPIHALRRYKQSQCALHWSGAWWSCRCLCERSTGALMALAKVLLKPCWGLIAQH